MNTPFRLLFVCALLAPAAFAAESFEGKVNLKMSSGDGKSQDVHYSMKGDKIRVEMPAMKGMGGMIIDTTRKETTMLMDEEKMYMTMATPDVAASPAAGKQEEATLEKTSETEKILGYTATKYISTQDGTKTELWLAEGLGSFLAPSGGNPMAGGSRGGGRGMAPQSWERALAGKALFPLRVVGKNAAGKESFRMEATAINKQSLPDSLFAPPAGYQKFDMGGMMKGMMPGIGR